MAPRTSSVTSCRAPGSSSVASRTQNADCTSALGLTRGRCASANTNGRTTIGGSTGVRGWMAAGLAAGLILGLAAALTQHPVLLGVARGLRPIGVVFLNLLSMVVIPLVAAALFTGVAGLGDIRQVGRLGVRTLAFFWLTTLAAIVIGFALAKVILPLGAMSPEQQTALRALAGADSSVVRHAAEQLPSGTSFLTSLVPANPLRAAVDGSLLPLIVFVTIFAVATASLPPEKRAALTGLADAATQALI